MSTYQKVIIVGHVGQEPTTKIFDDGGSVTNFSVATTEHWKNKQTGEKQSRTEWHNIVTRNKTAELCDKYLDKGDKVLIEGKLQTRKWQDTNGADRWSTEIMATNITFMTSKAEKEQRQKENSKSVIQPSQQQQPASQSSVENFPDSNPNDEDHDDLPF